MYFWRDKFENDEIKSYKLKLSLLNPSFSNSSNQKYLVILFRRIKADLAEANTPGDVINS